MSDNNIEYNLDNVLSAKEKSLLEQIKWNSEVLNKIASDISEKKSTFINDIFWENFDPNNTDFEDFSQEAFLYQLYQRINNRSNWNMDLVSDKSLNDKDVSIVKNFEKIDNDGVLDESELALLQWMSERMKSDTKFYDKIHKELMSMFRWVEKKDVASFSEKAGLFQLYQKLEGDTDIIDWVIDLTVWENWFALYKNFNKELFSPIRKKSAELRKEWKIKPDQNINDYKWILTWKVRENLDFYNQFFKKDKSQNVLIIQKLMEYWDFQNMPKEKQELLINDVFVNTIRDEFTYKNIKSIIWSLSEHDRSVLEKDFSLNLEKDNLNKIYFGIKDYFRLKWDTSQLSQFVSRFDKVITKTIATKDIDWMIKDFSQFENNSENQQFLWYHLDQDYINNWKSKIFDSIQKMTQSEKYDDIMKYYVFQDTLWYVEWMTKINWINIDELFDRFSKTYSGYVADLEMNNMSFDLGYGMDWWFWVDQWKTIDFEWLKSDPKFKDMIFKQYKWYVLEKILKKIFWNKKSFDKNWISDYTKMVSNMNDEQFESLVKAVWIWNDINAINQLESYFSLVSRNDDRILRELKDIKQTKEKEFDMKTMKGFDFIAYLPLDWGTRVYNILLDENLSKNIAPKLNSIEDKWFVRDLWNFLDSIDLKNKNNDLFHSSDEFKKSFESYIQKNWKNLDKYNSYIDNISQNYQELNDVVCVDRYIDKSRNEIINLIDKDIEKYKERYEIKDQIAYDLLMKLKNGIDVFTINFDVDRLYEKYQNEISMEEFDYMFEEIKHSNDFNEILKKLQKAENAHDFMEKHWLEAYLESYEIYWNAEDRNAVEQTLTRIDSTQSVLNESALNLSFWSYETTSLRDISIQFNIPEDQIKEEIWKGKLILWETNDSDGMLSIDVVFPAWEGVKCKRVEWTNYENINRQILDMYYQEYWMVFDDNLTDRDIKKRYWVDISTRSLTTENFDQINKKLYEDLESHLNTFDVENDLSKKDLLSEIKDQMNIHWIKALWYYAWLISKIENKWLKKEKEFSKR